MIHRNRRRAALSVAIATAALVFAILAPVASAALRHIDGTVLSKDASRHSFRVVTQRGARIRIEVNAKTRFDRIGGFAGLHKGLAVEVEVTRTDNGLLAKHVEPHTSGGGGGHSGDDGPNHA